MTENNQNKNEKLSFWQFLNTVKWLIGFNFKMSPFATVGSFVSEIIINLSPLLNAYIFARLLDGIIRAIGKPNSSPNEIIPLLGVLLAYNLIISALRYVDSYFSNVMSYASSLKAPQFFYKHINTLGIQTLENPDVANKIQRTREILGALNTDFNRATDFVSKIITFISSSIVIFKIMPFVALIIASLAIPEIISNRIFMRRSWRIYRDETENRRRANLVAGTLIETSNLQEITITGAYGYLSNLYKKFADRFVALDLRNTKKWQTYGFLSGSVTDVASIFGYFMILKNLFNKLISVGDVTFQMRSLDIFVNSFANVSNGYVSLYERCIRINEAKFVFDMKPLVADGNSELEKSEVAPEIKFSRVSFKYPNSENYVISNLSLTIKPGEKIAIVGENGAGKTTLVKLISRFYKVDKGNIFIDDKNINNIKIDSWYKNLGVLFQDYNTYSCLTLKENIYLGESDEELDEAKVKIAVQKANVDSFAESYKHGLEQILSEKFKGGVRPSTGQWQKIAIARFFYRNSPVVIFDEPTSSIDAISESKIFSQIYDFFKRKTVIIISHRFSTVRNADRIYVVDKGEIVESGNHEQLMKKKGRYAKAFTVQAEGYQ